MAKRIPERSIQAQQLIERLEEATTGELIPYAELSALIGEDVQNEARGYLATARRRLLKDKQLFFATIFNEGVRLLNSSEVVNTIDPAGRVHRIALRSKEALAAADYGELSTEDRTTLNLKNTIIHFVGHLTKRKSQLLIQQRVGETALPPGRLLELFSKSQDGT
jgi:hypothetical protein